MNYSGQKIRGALNIASRRVLKFLNPFIETVGRLFSTRFIRQLVVAGPVAFTLLQTPAGTYLERSLFLFPAQRVRAALDVGPKLHESIRLVVVDDPSLKKLGRFPTFGEWQRISEHLYRLGIKRTLIYGFLNLAQDLGEPLPNVGAGEIFSAMTLTDNARNTLAIATSEIPDALQIGVDTGLSELPELSSAKLAIGPSKALLPFLNGLGDLGADDFGNMNYAIRTTASSVIPNLAFRGAASLRWEVSGFVTEAGRYPRSFDDRLYPEFVAPDKIFQRSIPVSAFFAKSYDRILTKVPQPLSDLIVGAEVAILVPQAHTGQRFVESPSGRIPSYMAVTSLVSGILKNRALFVACPRDWVVAAWLLCLLVLLSVPRFAISAWAGGSAIVVMLVFCFGALHILGWILPCAEMWIIGVITLVQRILSHLLSTIVERKALAKDLDLGRMVQSYLLPETLVGQVGSWQYKVVFKPHGAMSGDWVQIHQSPPGTVQSFAMLAIGDVIGKGSSAALATSLIAGIWSMFRERWEREPVNLEEFVSTIDRLIERTFRGQVNSTLHLAFLTEDKAVVTFFGNTPWVRISAAGRAAKLRAKPHAPLGLKGTFAYRDIEVLPDEGDLFVAYSDGVIDGGAGYSKFVGEMADVPLPDTELVFDVIEASARRSGESSVLPDDFTLLMIRRFREVKSATVRAG